MFINLQFLSQERNKIMVLLQSIKKVSSGIWGMIDGNGNKIIINSNISWYWMNEAVKKGYLFTSFNMNTECQNAVKMTCDN